MGAAAGTGEGAVFAGAVVLDLEAADQLLPDGDLDGVGNDGDLDLAAPRGGPDPAVRSGEADVPDESTLRVTDGLDAERRDGLGDGAYGDVGALGASGALVPSERAMRSARGQAPSDQLLMVIGVSVAGRTISPAKSACQQRAMSSVVVYRPPSPIPRTGRGVC